MPRAWLDLYEQQVDRLVNAGGWLRPEQVATLNAAIHDATLAVGLQCIAMLEAHPGRLGEVEQWVATALQPLGGKVAGVGTLLSYAPLFAQPMGAEWQAQLARQLAQLMGPAAAPQAEYRLLLCELVAGLFRNPVLTRLVYHEAPGCPGWMTSPVVAHRLSLAAAGISPSNPPREKQPGWGSARLPADVLIGDVAMVNDTLQYVAGHQRGAPSTGPVGEAGLGAAFEYLAPAMASTDFAGMLVCGSSALATNLTNGRWPKAPSGGLGGDQVKVSGRAGHRAPLAPPAQPAVLGWMPGCQEMRASCQHLHSPTQPHLTIITAPPPPPPPPPQVLKVEHDQVVHVSTKYWRAYGASPEFVDALREAAEDTCTEMTAAVYLTAAGAFTLVHVSHPSKEFLHLRHGPKRRRMLKLPISLLGWLAVGFWRVLLGVPLERVVDLDIPLDWADYDRRIAAISSTRARTDVAGTLGAELFEAAPARRAMMRRAGM